MFDADGSSDKKNQNRISDAAAELLHVAGDDKKAILIFWWWNPKEDPPVDSAVSYTTYGLSWDKAVRAGVNGLGGWNFSGSGNVLSTYVEPSGKVLALWNQVKAKIKSWKA